jgi:hypothetical protein
MLGFPDAEPGAGSSTPSLLTLNHGEETPISHALRPRRPPRYSDPASPSGPLRLLRLTPQPSKSHSDIPNELWDFIFKLLVPSDIPTHLTLVRVRGVCRSWREIAERLIREEMKSLVASPKLFDSPSGDFSRNFPREIQVWLEQTFARLVEGQKGETHRRSDSGTELQLVSFHFDERYHPDQNLAKFFVSALSNCVRAEITVNNFPTSTSPFSSFDAHESRSLPTIPLRELSFSSMDLGIRDTLPQKFDFPWHSLQQELPWSQLTDITLDCVLSYDDALTVLSAAVNVGTAELGRLSSTGLGSSAMFDITSTTLHTLKINTCVDLRPLFRRLDLPALEDLQLAAYRASISNAPQNHILNPSLNVRWNFLKKLSLQSDSTYRQCDLNSILRHCCQLNQLEWDGDHSEFNHLPFEALTRLQGLTFVSDQDGHKRLFKKISLLRDITKLSLFHYHTTLGGNHNLTNLLHITISGPISLVHLFQILRSRTRRLLSGDFRLSTVTRFCPAPLRCEALQVLKLDLVNAPSFPWGKLHASQLKTLKINVGGRDQSSMRREMEAFRSVHLDTIISISAD